MTARLSRIAREMLATLETVEKKMTDCPAFNAWDLGPTPTLVEVRAMIRKARGTK